MGSTLRLPCPFSQAKMAIVGISTVTKQMTTGCKFVPVLARPEWHKVSCFSRFRRLPSAKRTVLTSIIVPGPSWKVPRVHAKRRSTNSSLRWHASLTCALGAQVLLGRLVQKVCKARLQFWQNIFFTGWHARHGSPVLGVGRFCPIFLSLLDSILCFLSS